MTNEKPMFRVLSDSFDGYQGGADGWWADLNIALYDSVIAACMRNGIEHDRARHIASDAVLALGIERQKDAN